MRLGAIILAALSVAIVAAAPAAADWGPPSLLTASPLEQADAVAASALSADGRYLAFSGSLDGIAGVLRRDLRTGAVEPVAAADAYGTAPIRDARDPSISADGRYVSFTTSAVLDPADDTNAAPDVYVRDMEASAPADGGPCGVTGPCAYTLASAADGTTAGLTYTGSGGSVAAPRQALSADGRRVVFLVKAGSDLVGPGTPAGQVAVRDLDTRRTLLVSSERDPASGAMTGEPVPGGAVSAASPVLSADGSTVAWSGTNIGLQAATVGGDPAATTDPYNEPLWRRIAGGPSAPTRRVAGAGDPEAPGCPPGGTLANPACQGPYPELAANAALDFNLQGGWVTTGGSQPAISADGWTVALTGTPPLQPNGRRTRAADLFVADMHPGLARRAAVRRLTEEPDGGALIDFDSAGDSVGDVGISPDGSRIAFTTSRVVFPLATPFLVGAPPAQPGGDELWLVDLAGQSLQRLSTTVDGGASLGGGASSPSFDTSGQMLAFDSAASNLVAVDANDANDAFLVRDDAVPAGLAGRVDISAPPRPPRIRRAWRLALSAVARRDGSVRLDADCPGSGSLQTTVTATVPVWRTVEVKMRSGKRRTARRRVLVTRQVAAASMRVRGGGPARLRLNASKAYKSLVRGEGGLEATAKVTFTAPKRATLHDALAVRFRLGPARKAER